MDMAMAATAQWTSSFSQPSQTFQFQWQCKSTRFISSSSSSIGFPQTPFACSFYLPIIKSNKGVFRVLAVAEEQPSLSSIPSLDDEEKDDDGVTSKSSSKVKSCQLYVCNLPRSYDMSELLNMFKTYGSVESIEISRNAETGISKGCGYVTMSSIGDAIAAVVALDGCDVGGREMRVKFSEDMNKKKNIQVVNSVTKKSLIFETPHKLYVGNLAWSTKPENLRQHFTQFGNVVSVRVLFDRKGGKNRVYAFLSFSSDDELNAAISSDGTEFLGRKVVARNALKSDLPQPQ